MTTTCECYIFDVSRDVVFYGTLNKNLVGTVGYYFYEVPESIKDRPLKVENGEVVVDFQKEYNDKINYQKASFIEFRDAILKQILYADAIGATDTVTSLKQSLSDELSNYESRVNAIIMETE